MIPADWRATRPLKIGIFYVGQLVCHLCATWLKMVLKFQGKISRCVWFHSLIYFLSISFVKLLLNLSDLARCGFHIFNGKFVHLLHKDCLVVLVPFSTPKSKFKK